MMLPRLAQPFDYQGVQLAPSRWQRQMMAARDFYLGLPDDDILHGFRKAAGLPAPGKPLGGWCGENSNMVFGQWLSGMSRLSRVLDDAALRDKAIGLFDAWARTVGADGDCHMPHYTFDKLVGGLVDLAHYGGHAAAWPVLSRGVAHALRTYDSSNRIADPTDPIEYQGFPSEWYTLSEHLFRAYVHSGDAAYRDAAQAFLYHQYWDQFVDSDAPAHAHGVHAYSHVNTFSSAMMAYAVLGEQRYLRMSQHAASYVRRHQAFATGGYGPNERFVALDDSLGRSLDTRSDTCEVSCCTWAGFKLASYLMQYTCEVQHGDWIEQLLYNAIGAALPIAEGGRAYYYGDYRVGGGMKVYNWEMFTCCSGTYLQNVAEYHNLIYYHDAQGLYVNLYLPSTVTWQHGGATVRVRQDTAYPESGEVRLSVSTSAPDAFVLRLRVPAWASGATLSVNGEPVAAPVVPGAWAQIERTWQDGDRVDLSLPLPFRQCAVDAHHPDRVALMRGPVVYVLEGAYHDPAFRMPADDAALATWLQPEPAGRAACTASTSHSWTRPPSIA